MSAKKTFSTVLRLCLIQLKKKERKERKERKRKKKKERKKKELQLFPLLVAIARGHSTRITSSKIGE